MKKLFFIFLILFVKKAFCQINRDTTFLLKNMDPNFHQLIFIDKPNSIYHKKLIENIKESKNEVQEKIKNITSNFHMKFDKIKFKNQGDWVSIYKFKNRNYCYYPSEPFFNLFISISDSIIILNDFNEGFTPLLIKKYLINSNSIIYFLVDENKKNIKMKFILNKDGTASFNCSNFNRKNIMLVRKDSIFKLPIIVNYCPNYRCAEFKFKNH